MISRDKPKRPGAKPFDRDRKPRDGAGKPAGKKPFGAGAKAGGFTKSERGPAKSQGPRKDTERDFGKKAKSSAPAAASGHSAGQEPERISKLLARAGVASRRDIERMIMEGRVSLNGAVLDTPVVNVTFADHIEVDGVPIRGIERTRLWLYHKPAGLVTTNSDPEGRPTVFEHLPADLPRVMSIGRLDINTEGILLLTNDGGLARVLELPTTGWLRRYRVRAHGKIEQEALDGLKDGIAVDGVLYGGIEATLDKVQGSNVWITMGLREGKNREIKNVLGALGLEVNRLIRISYGPFQLGDLPEGHAQEIRGRTLRDQLGPRLIEEAKANFEAPLFDQQHDDKEEALTRAQKGGREERGPSSFREKDGDRREKARARLDTKRDDRFGDKRGEHRGRDRDDDRFDDRPKREPGHRARKSNVWMAPGARPVAEKGQKAAEGEEAVKRTPRDRPEGAPKTKRYGRTRDGEATKSTHKFDPDRKKPGGRFEERGDRDRNRDSNRGARGPRVLGAGDEGGEWIRASEPEAQSRDDRGGGFGRSRSGDERAPRDFGDRPGRDDRKPRGKPFGERSGDKPFGKREDRPFRGRENDRGERSFGDRPSGGRGGERSFGDKPSGGRGGERAFGGKPGGKSFGGKPSFGKSAGGRPGGKPGGGRPAGKPGGGRPAGGKPRGRGN
ncbi:pseudouridine synthase [Rhizobium sp. ARZ01]|uniref:pseudouridine synthase n=1 Tax=Rhizobium sp. ARZ01 TaxID=2769313 RepID=UPI0017802466|nr:pseudouridine synthase [Rhizobium sp. ARZ01]MBD9371204.1 pseudouridine synthase [Rhizobium sp. ARZ01]